MVVRTLNVEKDHFQPTNDDKEILGLEVPYLSAMGALLFLASHTRPGYMSDPHTGRSQPEYVFTSSIKQTMNATSSNYAKILAIHEASRECVWLRSVIQHIRESCGISLGQESPTFVHEDNATCTAQLKDGYIKGDKTKHILPKLFFTYDLQKSGDIRSKASKADWVNTDFILSIVPIFEKKDLKPNLESLRESSSRYKRGKVSNKLEKISTMAITVEEEEKENSRNQRSIYTLGIVNAQDINEIFNNVRGDKSIMKMKGAVKGWNNDMVGVSDGNGIPITNMNLRKNALIKNGAIYPNQVVLEPGYDIQRQKTRTQIQGEEGTTEGKKQNRNKSKSWKIGEIKYMQNITCWNCNQKGYFQNQCSKLVASRGKEVNMAAKDSDDALCCVENTVEDHIMDSGASFHATNCKEELDRFKLRSGKVCLADDKTLDIAGIRDIILKTSFGTSWTLKVIKYFPGLKRRLISVRQLDEEGYHVGFRDQQWKVNKGSRYYDTVIKDCSRSCDRYNANLQFGVAERLSRTFRAEITRIRAEASKMLWANSVSTTYLIYCIPNVPIGLRILEEEWQGKDTSLAHLKVFGCDSFVKVRDVYREAMKCTFIGSGSDEVRYNFRDTKSH
ncbi:retrovirus-related pol polyprotein from transposon TNT 1-94 [Tanacetum coccineum]